MTDQRKYIRKYGYSLSEVAKEMKLSKQRVWVLAEKGSPRFTAAVKAMKRRKT